ncbi:MAG: hypothetical protein K6E13_03470 [Lachnospiraceae bacterium]|nr:hypothetical protein [Lachnospiraceae bacterium]
MAGLGISGIGNISSMNRIEPLQYSVKNEAEVSDVFTNESVSGGGKVDSVNPVIYPNARSSSTTTPSVDTARIMQASKEYNEVALGFGGMNTGYSSTAASYGYGIEGSLFDTYV